jgi:dTMP kinase
MSRRRGRFIVLEGADGSGKSTQAKRLAGTLAAAGREVLHLRDPGSTRLAEAVRAILLDRAQGPIDVAAEACLYFAARAQLAAEVIEPALARGAIVLCERWTLSTEIYQGVAGGMGTDRVRRLERLVVPRARPDLVIVLDVRAGEGLARIGRDLDRMEAKGRRFHDEVVRSYRRLAKGRARHVTVRAGTLDSVARALAAAAEGVL